MLLPESVTAADKMRDSPSNYNSANGRLEERYKELKMILLLAENQELINATEDLSRASTPPRS